MNEIFKTDNVIGMTFDPNKDWIQQYKQFLINTNIIKEKKQLDNVIPEANCNKKRLKI